MRLGVLLSNVFLNFCGQTLTMKENKKKKQNIYWKVKKMNWPVFETLKILIRQYTFFTIFALLFHVFNCTNKQYLWLIWVPLRLDIVSSKFCLRSAIFFTVLILLVSGSSPAINQPTNEYEYGKYIKDTIYVQDNMN